MAEEIKPAKHATRTIREQEALDAGLNARGMVLKDRPTLASLDARMGAVEERAAEPGPAGQDGTDGVDGARGAAGKDGRDGVDGKQGIPGAAGRDGTNGTNGKDGLPGAAGKDGVNGTNGKDAGTWQVVEGLAVPPVLSLLGSEAKVDVVVTWPTPFPDASYVVTATVIPAAATLLGRTSAALKAGTRTATGCTVTVLTNALVAAGQATVTVRADRKA
jgi:hypothetical protein